MARTRIVPEMFFAKKACIFIQLGVYSMLFDENADEFR